MYLDTGVVKDIRARFKDESEIQLQEFLEVSASFSVLCQLLRVNNGGALKKFVFTCQYCSY